MELVGWIESDGLLRTDEDLMAEMQRELGFKRRGKRIEDALARAIRRARPVGDGSLRGTDVHDDLSTLTTLPNRQALATATATLLMQVALRRLLTILTRGPAVQRLGALHLLPHLAAPLGQALHDLSCRRCHHAPP